MGERSLDIIKKKCWISYFLCTVGVIATSRRAHALPDAEVCNYGGISQKCLNPRPADGARRALLEHSLNSFNFAHAL